MLEFSTRELYAKAVQLGVIKDGEELPTSAMGRVKAALVEEQRAARGPSDDGPYIGGHITIRPGSSIELDGQPLPAAAEGVEVRISADPNVPSTVRLTLLAHTIQTIKE